MPGTKILFGLSINGRHLRVVGLEYGPRPFWVKDPQNEGNVPT